MSRVRIGGQSGLNDPRPGVNRGVYAEHPAGTPKYNPNNSFAVAQNNQARMYIELPDIEHYDRFMESLPDDASRAYARQLYRTGDGQVRRAYLNFLVQSVQEQFTEKVQVSEVLSDAYIAYFFGQSAPTFNFSALLLNTQQDNWYDAWTMLYRQFLRGTRLSERGYPVTIVYDTRVVRGFLVNSATSIDANTATAANLSFSVLVKDLRFLAQSEVVADTETFAVDVTATLNMATAAVANAVNTAGASLDEADKMTGVEAATNAAKAALHEAVRAGADMAAVEKSANPSASQNYNSANLDQAVQ